MYYIFTSRIIYDPNALARDHVNNFWDTSTPICQTGDTSTPICQTGDTSTPICQTGDTSTPICQTGDTSTPICQTGDTSTPICQTGDTSTPLCKTESLTGIYTGAEKLNPIVIKLFIKVSNLPDFNNFGIRMLVITFLIMR